MATKKANKIINVKGKKTIANEEYYLGNTNLPTRDSKYVFTPEMVEELDKCKNDIIYFAEHYFYVNGINGKEIIKLFDKQRKILRTIQGSKKSLLVTSRQWGKCLSGQTKVKIKCKFLPFSIKIPVGILYKLIKFINKLLISK